MYSDYRSSFCTYIFYKKSVKILINHQLLEKKEKNEFEETGNNEYVHLPSRKIFQISFVSLYNYKYHCDIFILLCFMLASLLLKVVS